MANLVSLHRVTVIQNANSTGARISGFTLDNAVGFSNRTGSLITSSVDTISPVDIVFTAQKATAGDTIKLRSFRSFLVTGTDWRVMTLHALATLAAFLFVAAVTVGLV